MVFDGAKAGNASLIKRLEEMTRLSAAAAEIDSDAPARARPPKLGKKQIQQQEALAAGADSEWGSDLAPPPGRLAN